MNAVTKALSALLLFSVSVLGYAQSVIVTTGPGYNEYGGENIFGTNGSNPNYSVGQSIAGEFSITSATDITSVEGWLSTATSGTMTAVIYRNNNNLPGTQLLSEKFTISPAPPPEPGALPGATWCT